MTADIQRGEPELYRLRRENKQLTAERDRVNGIMHSQGQTIQRYRDALEAATVWVKCDDPEHAERDRYRGQAETWAEYVEFLNEANNGPIGLARIHGWRCPDEDVRKGQEFRDRIAALNPPEES